jgi:hypothetical protein
MACEKSRQRAAGSAKFRPRSRSTAAHFVLIFGEPKIS